MNDKKRLLTLLIEIDEHKNASWIWDSHMQHRPWNGVYIKAICEGNQLKDFEEQEEDHD